MSAVCYHKGSLVLTTVMVMLKSFEVENFRGFQNPIRLCLVARNYDYNPAVVKDGLVKNAILYGPNGIGKSSLGLALFDAARHLTDTTPFPAERLEPYCNLDNPADRPACFTYELLCGETTIRYRYEKRAPDALVRETLCFDGHKVVDYCYAEARQEARFVDKSVFGDIKTDLPDNRLSILKYLHRNLPTGTVPALDAFFRFFEGMLWYRSLSEGNSYAGFTTGSRMLEDVIFEANALPGFVAFLEENGLHYDLTFREVDGKPRLIARFKDGREAFFGSVASTGTKALMLFYSWKISAFSRLSFLFIDEFDAFLHYQSAAAIVRLLNEHTDFQTVLTTHNTYLMQNAFTRPDACFLMGEQRVACLADATQKEIRAAHNLENLYLNGAFRV